MIDAGPSLSGFGVKSTVQVFPASEVTRLAKVPPLASTRSARVNPVTVASKVIVRLPFTVSASAVVPTRVTAAVGVTVSSVNVKAVLLAVLPAVSVSVTITVWLSLTVGAV